jgi:hypothetical protein
VKAPGWLHDELVGAAPEDVTMQRCPEGTVPTKVALEREVSAAREAGIPSALIDEARLATPFDAKPEAFADNLNRIVARELGGTTQKPTAASATAPLVPAPSPKPKSAAKKAPEPPPDPNDDDDDDPEDGDDLRNFVERCRPSGKPGMPRTHLAAEAVVTREPVRLSSEPAPAQTMSLETFERAYDGAPRVRWTL